MEKPPFLEDIYPRNLLYAITIRSPIAKGHLKMIQVPVLPDHYTCITARNIPGINKFGDTEMPILADTWLSYIGEPVAILLGPDKIKLDNLAKKCVVLTNEDEPHFDCHNTPLYPESLKREFTIGNPDKYFEREMNIQDKRILTSLYRTGIQDHWYAEPAGAISYYNKHESHLLNIKTATQWPSHVRKCTAKVLGINPNLIDVETTALSLHMDGKIWFPSFVACHAALGTFITKKPVRLILNREEDFMYSPKRCETNIDISTAIDNEGKITCAKIDISINLGAFEVNGNEIIDQICIGVAALYKIPNMHLNAKAYLTNIPPQGPFSGFGVSQGRFAIERHISLIADTIHVDPAQHRIVNLNQGTVNAENQSSPIQFPLSPFPVSLIDMIIKKSDYSRKWTAYELLRQENKGSPFERGSSPRGIGLAIGFQGNGLLYNNDCESYSVEVTLTKNSTLEIKTSLVSSEDYGKIWEKIACHILSIESDMVKIITVSRKDKIPDSGPSCSSRNITLITKLVEKCCIAIRKQRFRSPLPITIRRSSKIKTKGEGIYFDPSCFQKPGYACAVVELSIDLVECTPKVRGIWLGVDGGRIISKNRAKRSLFRSTVQALGWAYTEYIEYVNGKLPKTQYDNFTIPSSIEIPPIHIEFFNEDKSASNEIRGIGELPFTCVPAAFLQAASLALDNPFNHIPLKRKDIWEMVRHKDYDNVINDDEG